MRGISTKASRLTARSAGRVALVMAPLLAVATVALTPAVARAPTPAAAAARSTSYTIWTVAGMFAPCSAPPACGDGHPAAGAALSFPQAVAVGPTGDVYIADWGDSEVREVTPTGEITVIAGTGTFCQNPPHCGDRRPATTARLSFPAGVAVDAAGNVYVADTQDDEIRKISTSGTITRLAGTGSPCAHPPSCGDGGMATSARLTDPTGLAVDRAGNLFIADSGDQEIREVAPGGRITRVAGTGKRCARPPACGDAGPASSAQLSFPGAVALGRGGVLYIADTGDQEVRRVSAAGTITTVAGTGVACASPPSCGDGGVPTQAQLNYPGGVAIGPQGNLFIADSADNELREVRGGHLVRVAGTGRSCSKSPCGDNLAASAATLNYPDSVAVDRHGDIYLADAGDNEIRWLSGVHAGRIPTSTGRVALSAFSATVTKGAVVLRFILGRPANVELTIRHAGHSETGGAGRAHAGFNERVWNRRFGGKPAARGLYKLVVSAVIGRRSTSSTLRVTI